MASAKQGNGKASKAAGKNDNRRKFDRRDTHIVAQLNHEGTPTVGMVTNLSLEGCLFAPRLDIPVGDRIQLKLAGENKPVNATVKAVSELGVHCLLHAGGATLGRLSVEVDDMALLMLNAGRPHAVEPPAIPAAAAKKPAAKKKAVKKPAAKKKSAKKKTAPKAKTKAPAAKTVAKKKPATKKKVVKKAVKKKAAKPGTKKPTAKKPATKKKVAARKRK